MQLVCIASEKWSFYNRRVQQHESIRWDPRFKRRCEGSWRHGPWPSDGLAWPWRCTPLNFRNLENKQVSDCKLRFQTFITAQKVKDSKNNRTPWWRGWFPCVLWLLLCSSRQTSRNRGERRRHAKSDTLFFCYENSLKKIHKFRIILFKNN